MGLKADFEFEAVSHKASKTFDALIVEEED